MRTEADVYFRLGLRLNENSVKMLLVEPFFKILEEFYTPEQAEIGEQENREYTGTQSSGGDPGFELAPSSIRIVHNRTHYRIVHRIEHPGKDEDSADPPHRRIRNIQDIREIEQKEHTGHGVEHVPADSAQAECVVVAFTDVHVSGNSRSADSRGLLWRVPILVLG